MNIRRVIIICFIFVCFVVNLYSAVSQIDENSSVSKYKMMILCSSLSEKEWAKRLEKASAQLGWKCEIFFPKILKFNETQSLSSNPINLEQLQAQMGDEHVEVQSTIEHFNPDFIVSLSEERIYSTQTPHYLALTVRSPYQFYQSNYESDSFFSFNGYLVSTTKIDNLKKCIKSKGKPFQAVDWYASCPTSQFLPLKPKGLFYWGFWADTRLDFEEFYTLFSSLDKEGYLNVYGISELWSFIPNSVKPTPALDGESTLKAIRESGVMLILHSRKHFESESPSSRVFEAAAAGSVIICDRHPFVEREFGDSILYLDNTLNGEELFKQINHHVSWIFSHPEEASSFAKKAHSIFLSKFTLEEQLIKLAKFHESISIKGPVLLH